MVYSGAQKQFGALGQKVDIAVYVGSRKAL
jgi:hypothetical protein